MELIFDGQSINEDLGSEECFNKVNDYIIEKQNEGKVLRHLYINDQEAENHQEELTSSLENGEVDKVEIVTITQEELFQETLLSNVDYIKKLITYVEDMNSKIQNGKGFDKSLLIEITDGLEWVYNTSNNTAVIFEDSKMKADSDQLQNIFKNLIFALQKKELQAVKNLIENELLDNLNNIKVCFEKQIEDVGK